MSYGFREKYKTVAKRAQEAQAKIKELKKKNPHLNPVSIEGRQIAKTWWGKAWTGHLKYYADYDNRVGRGRSYVKNGLVIHLELKNGQVEAMVMGTRKTPYKINIMVKKIADNKWEKIKKLSHSHLHSLTDLFEGKFPKELEQVFSNHSEGVFPSLGEMDFNCSCPDWANMCKHISASLFAVGARLDESPELIFKLRGVKISDLIESAVKAEVSGLVRTPDTLRSKNKLSLSEKKLASLFEIKLMTPKKK